MSSVSKSFILLLIVLLAVSSLIMAKPAFAQTPISTPSTIPTPSVPEFTVKFVLSSNNITTIDPYTGQSTTKQYENNTVQLVIKNQAFVPPDDLTTFNYYVRYKGYSQENWTEVSVDSTAQNFLYPQNTSSENTSISLWGFLTSFFSDVFPI